MEKPHSPLARKLGKAPGTLVHVGDKKAADVNLRRIAYSADSFDDDKAIELSRVRGSADEEINRWLIVSGLHDVRRIGDVCKRFGIHPLTAEDILNTAQRPKIEVFDHYVMMVLKLPSYDGNELTEDQISMVVGSNFLLLFEEQQNNTLAPVIDRLRSEKGRLRKSGCDYLAYAIIDLIVDCSFPVLEALGDQIEKIEDTLIAGSADSTIGDLHGLKSKLIHLRKQLSPLRDIISRLKKEDIDLISESTRPFLNDVNDHVAQILDTVESHREMSAGLTDLYLSLMGNKTNEAMKVLTIIATIFIPMTFIVGVYGMNFRYMPELEWKHGYLLVWILIVAVAAAMFIWFKRKKLI